MSTYISAANTFSALRNDPILQKIQRQEGFCGRFKAFFHKTTPLKRALEIINKQPDLSANWETVRKRLLTAMGSREFLYLRSSVRLVLRRLNKDQLGDFLEALIKTAVNSKASPDLVARCMDLIEFKQLQELISDQLDRLPLDPLIERMASHEGKRRALPGAQPILKRHAPYLIKFLHALIDTVLMAFSFFEIGREPASSWEASHYLMIYGKLVAFPVLLFAALSAVLAPVTALVVTAAIVVAVIAAVLVYVKWIKPCPDHIDPCINLTLEAQQGNLEPVLGRDEIIDQIIRSLASTSRGTRCHPLLSGPSGVGKTEIIRGLAQRIAAGNVPAKLKGKKVFILNTAQLNVDSFFQDKLERMLKRLGKYKEDVIVFFDEIHVAMQKQNQAKIGERLKTVFDTTTGSLPYCIAATTDGEYKLIEKDKAFARRFKKIEIKTIEDVRQTTLILQEVLHREAPDLEASPDSFKAILEQSNAALQPASAKQLLADLISKIRTQQDSAFSPEAMQKKEEHDRLFREYQLNADKTEEEPLWTRMTELEQELKVIKQNHANELEKLEELRLLRKQFLKHKESLFQIAHQIEKLNKTNKNPIQLKKRFALTRYLLLPSLTKDIEALREQCILPTQIDRTFVERVVKEQMAEK